MPNRSILYYNNVQNLVMVPIFTKVWSSVYVDIQKLESGVESCKYGCSAIFCQPFIWLVPKTIDQSAERIAVMTSSSISMFGSKKFVIVADIFLVVIIYSLLPMTADRCRMKTEWCARYQWQHVLLGTQLNILNLECTQCNICCRIYMADILYEKLLELI